MDTYYENIVQELMMSMSEIDVLEFNTAFMDMMVAICIDKDKKIEFIALDAPDLFKPIPKQGSESKSLLPCPDITLFNFSGYKSDKESFCAISSFLIDLLLQKKKAYYLYPICHHVFRKYMQWDDFINAVLCDYVDYDVTHENFIVDISTPEQLQQAYNVHLPELGCRSTVKNQEEVFKFLCLSLMCLAKTSEFKQFDIFLKNQVKNLESGRVSQLLRFFNKDIAVEIAKQPDINSKNYTRVFLVKWILDNRSKMHKPLSTYMEKVCKEWKGSRMTHICLIKEYISDKAYDKLIKWKAIIKKSSSSKMLMEEIEAFETVVMPHINYEYFEYIRLVQSKNVFRGASARLLPYLTNVAVKLAIPSNPRLKNYAVPRVPNDIDVIEAFIRFIQSD